MTIAQSPIAWGAWTPDLFDLNTSLTDSLKNVLARGDGYMPFQDFSALTAALPGACRGFFFARTAGALTVFAGTATNLYLLNLTDFTWSNVSKSGGPYADVASDAHWQFAQFNNVVVAVQENVVPQKYDTSADSAFSDLAGSPPQASYVSVINRFLVLSGLLSNPYRVQWSDLNNIVQWSTGLADSQDLPDGGTVRGVVGGEFGIIIQDLSMRRMIFSPGSDVVFQIDRLSKDTGALAPYSIVNASEKVFFLSPRGFIMSDGNGSLNPIGKERVDRTFLATFDDTNLQLVIGAADPTANRVLWSYRSKDGGTASVFDKILAYDWVLDKWSIIEMLGEYLAPLARPGLTLESLDKASPGALSITGAANNGSGLIRITVATGTLTTGQVVTITGVGGVTNANGTWTITVIDGTHIDLQGSTFAGVYTSGGTVGGSLDALTSSLDTFAVSALAQIAMASSAHTIGFFSGANLEAVIETSEQNDLGFRTYVNGIFPVTDADTVSVSVAMRDRFNVDATYGTESTMNSDGYCPLLEEGRYLRARMRIPAGTDWSFSTGLVPDTVRAGIW
jgi:hypothetical protein